MRSWAPTGLETKNECAGNGQKQFTGLDWTGLDWMGFALLAVCFMLVSCMVFIKRRGGAICSAEVSVDFHWTKSRYISEATALHAKFLFL
jgi:hypothetical protein